MSSSDRYGYISGWHSGTLKINIALFDSDLLDRNDELMQYPDKPVSEDNPILIIRSSPRDEGFSFMYTIRIFPEGVHIDKLHHGTVWTLTKDGDASSDPLSLDIEF